MRFRTRPLAIALLVAGCGSAPMLTVDAGADMTPAVVDLATTAPPGFWAPCSMSSDCAGFVQDQPPGFLGCESYIGVDHCSRSCSATAPCWAGTSCTCVTHTNAGGFPETDCYCA